MHRFIAAHLLFGLFLSSSPLPALETAAPMLAEQAESQAEKEEWLSWQAPPECPAKEQIYEQVRRWLGRELMTTVPLSVNAQVSWTKETWAVTVEHSYGANVGKRAVSVDSCAEAADFVALTVVLAVEPDFEAPSQVQVQPEAAVDESDAAASNSPSESESKEEKEGKAAPIAEERAQSLRGFIEVGLLGNFGALPEFAWGPEFLLGLRTGAFQWSLGGFILPPFLHRVEAAENDVRVSLISAQLSACYIFGEGRIHGGPCVGGQWGSMKAEESLSEGDAQGGREAWGALLGGGEVEWGFSSLLSTHLGANLLLPLTRTRLELSDGSAVFSTKSAGFEGKWGMRIFF